MKSNVKKFSSILLAVVMLFSMLAVLSVSAAETTDAAGAGQLTVTGNSNYCTASDAVTVTTGQTATVTFKVPATINLVDVQWGMTYDKTKLQLTGATPFNTAMLINQNATSYNVMGGISDNEAPAALNAGDTFITFRFRALAEGEAEVYLTVIDLMTRGSDGKDEIIINNGVQKSDGKFTVNAKSNFFESGSYTFNSVAGETYVTVEYKYLDAAKYIVNVHVDELTYDPAVLEWKEEYNTVGTGRSAQIDLFPFGEGYGTVSYHKTAEGRIVGHYSGVNPAAPAVAEGMPVTVVKATFKVLNANAGSTNVNCVVDTMALCDKTLAEPYMQYFAIDNKVVNDAVKGQATLNTFVYPSTPEQTDIIIGDVDNDGDVDINDATKLQTVLAEYSNTGVDLNNNLTFKRCDTNKDNKVDVRDVTEIQRYVAKVITSF